MSQQAETTGLGVMEGQEMEKGINDPQVYV